MSARIRVVSDSGEAQAEGEGALLDLAMEEDLGIPFGCTAARCGVCQVEVLDGGLAPASELEQGTLDQFGCGPKVRLACQAQIAGDVTLRPIN